MTLLNATSFIALLSTGLLAGIFFGNRMGTSFALPTIPVSSFVQFQQTIHKKYVRFMPPLQIIAILSSLIWLYLLRFSLSAPGFIMLAVAAAGIIIVFAITLTVNVPINKKLMTWSPANPPGNASEIWKPWEKGNTARTVLTLVVFVLQVLAINLPTPTSF
ncbi:membrane hypothetical protein [Candidatus Zixiibacteriota bacterium]|nr:membrane hypothetical protein [candidate division Zixibacteria bacterium]